METAQIEFEKIYETTYQKTLVYVTKRCGNLFDISDIMQEIYMEVYQTINNKGGGYLKEPMAFVLHVAKSKVYRHYTLQEKLKNCCPLFFQTTENEELERADLVENASLSPEEVTFSEERLGEVWRFLQTKPQEVQRVFYLFYYGELTISEIARELHLKESTVKNRIYRTTNEIRKQFKEG